MLNINQKKEREGRYDMIQHGRANGTDIISRDMTLEAVPLQLLSHFSPTCTVIIRQYLAGPITLAVSTGEKLHGKCPEMLQVANCISASSHPNPWKQRTRGLNQWNKKARNKKKCLSVNVIGSFFLSLDCMKTLTSSGVMSFPRGLTST